MGKDDIKIDGEDVVVREDTAKAYRVVRWGIITSAICLGLMALLLIGLFLKWVSN
jgi:hypothetical protein